MWNAYQGQDVTYVGGMHEYFVADSDNAATEATDDLNDVIPVDDDSLTNISNYSEAEPVHGKGIGGLIHGENPKNAADYKFDMVFGCQTKITGLFKTQLADGIMGMCLKPSSIFNQMHQQGIISSPSFSLCFTRADDATKKGSVAGALTMGGTDTNLHLNKMVYSDGFHTKGVMHGVTIRKVYIMESGQYETKDATKENTHVVDINESSLNSGSVIVDSGTTDTYMTRNLRVPFEKAFKKAIGFDYNDNGMHLKEEDVYKLPTIIIQLKGHEKSNNDLVEENNGKLLPGLAGAIDNKHPNDILIAIPPAHYIEFDTDHDKYVGRFSMTEGGGSVLGANTIRGHDVFFDIPESGRIGFAPSDCDYPQLLEHLTNEDGDDDTEEERLGMSEDDYYSYVDDEANDDNDDFDNDDDKEAELEKNVGSLLPYSDKESSPSNAIMGGIIGSFVVISLAIIAYRRNSTGSPGYSATEVMGDHANDLHLDTEIENLPAIA